MKMKIGLMSMCLVVLGMVNTTASAEQSYPSRPISLVVPFPPGGVTDLTARTYAKTMGEQLGIPIVVENRAGAGATIGATHVARATPDGYTLLFGGNVTHAISPHLLSEVRYDPLKDFENIGLFGTNGNVLVVPLSSPVTNFEEFIEHLKEKGDKATAASGSFGSSGHLAVELLKLKVPGLSYLHVPYNGLSAAITAVIGEQVDFMFTNIGAAIPQVQAGAVRAIAVTTAQRVPQLPDIPTVVESGITDFVVGGWFIAAAPKGTPKQIVNRLNEVLNNAQQDASLQKIMYDATVEIAPFSPQQVAEFTEMEYNKWGEVIRESNLKAD